MSNVKGYLAAAGALVLCPCHLPIIVAIAGGTALGTVVTDNLELLVPVAGLAFVGSLVLAFRWLGRHGESAEPACKECEAQSASMGLREPARREPSAAASSRPRPSSEPSAR